MGMYHLALIKTKSQVCKQVLFYQYHVLVFKLVPHLLYSMDMSTFNLSLSNLFIFKCVGWIKFLSKWDISTIYQIRS